MNAFENFVAAVRRCVKGDLTKEAVDTALAKAAKKNSEHLNYTESVVDKMKLLGLDSSLEGRQDLADALGYDGPDIGTPEGNTALNALIDKRLEERYIDLPK